MWIYLSWCRIVVPQLEYLQSEHLIPTSLKAAISQLYHTKLISDYKNEYLLPAELPI